MIELEKTYLVSTLPKNLSGCTFDDIVDQYIPVDAGHPSLRLRTRKGRIELTKKTPVADSASVQREQTIVLEPGEAAAIAELPAKYLAKRRYYLPVGDVTAEIDVYAGDLAGLVYVEFEFKEESQLTVFEQPGWCGVDVSEAGWAAAGVLAGKSYADLEPHLQELGYVRLDVADLLRDFS